jgi:hypothetical protein
MDGASLQVVWCEVIFEASFKTLAIMQFILTGRIEHYQMYFHQVAGCACMGAFCKLNDGLRCCLNYFENALNNFSLSDT